MIVEDLTWDSEFFGFKIGKIDKLEQYNLSGSNLLQTSNIHELVYVFSNYRLEDTPLMSLVDIKLDYKRVINCNELFNNENKEIVFYNTEYSFLINDIYELAFISGQYSRFKTDENFKNDSFKKLYKKWIDSSIKSDNIELILYVHDENVLGFVSVENLGNNIRIGLIAVDSRHQGKQIGSKLMMSVFNYAKNKKIFKVFVATQKENKNACNFYLKNKFQLHSEKFIYHIWNK
jgi:dTDP-4-amino-4,6-dideoxy-D-galactose acyltransferase